MAGAPAWAVKEPVDEVPAEVRATPVEALASAAAGGRCADASNDDWFPLNERPTPERRVAARRQCAGCPVRWECLELALRTGEDHGIWGGLLPGDRRQVLADRRRREDEAAAVDAGAGEAA